MISVAISTYADIGFEHMDGNGWGALMLLGMIVFGIAVVALVAWLVRGGGGQALTGAPRQPKPLEILDRRFAEGSISADEYRERREALREE